jgi:hypothetical protein
LHCLLLCLFQDITSRSIASIVAKNPFSCSCIQRVICDGPAGGSTRNIDRQGWKPVSHHPDIPGSVFSTGGLDDTLTISSFPLCSPFTALFSRFPATNGQLMASTTVTAISAPLTHRASFSASAVNLVPAPLIPQSDSQHSQPADTLGSFAAMSSQPQMMQMSQQASQASQQSFSMSQPVPQSTGITNSAYRQFADSQARMASDNPMPIFTVSLLSCLARSSLTGPL